VFVQSGSTWSQQAKLTVSGPPDAGFGGPVAISGSTVIVGSQDAGKAYQGAAYVFVRSGSTWSQQAELTASGAGHGQLGCSVAISGQTALIGAIGADAALVFVQSGSTWSEQAALTPSNATGLECGSVRISGQTAVIGRPHQNLSTGAAYVFAQSGSTWSQQAELTAPDGAEGDMFGSSVAISGETVLVGAPNHNSDTGAVYVFAQSGSTWSQQAELTPPGAAAGDEFGSPVAISGQTALIGEGGSEAVYVFAQSGSTWSQQAELTAPVAGDAFGSSVAIDGETAVIGAPYTNSDIGAAYVFAPV
jgi:hypothetical protein